MFFFHLILSSIASASLVYTPASFQPQTARVVVVLHGCLQSAEFMALGTGWNQVADGQNLLVIYPQAPAHSHPLDCWSWYEPDNQRADGGQLKVVVDEIRSVKRRQNVPAGADVYVVGISSGAATVAGLLACFPKEFKGGAMHSGPSYALAQNVKEAEKVLQRGPPKGPARGPCRPEDFSGRLFVIQGLADRVVNPAHADRILADFSRAQTHLEKVPALPHAWAGYADNFRHKKIVGPKGTMPTVLPFFSDLGPNATQEIWKFWTESR